jgi:multiple sugar transport system substrate-binding protein
MIENVTKSVNRKQDINEEYMENLYESVTSLYRLNQSGVSAVGKSDLGSMPTLSVVLLSTLGCTWVGILLYLFHDWNKKRKFRNKQNN